jgi:DUF4097 and DUF4098 domain-containing protein YvlB
MATLAESNTQAFTVNSTPTLTVDCSSGSVSVVPGEVGGITVTYTKKATSPNEDTARTILENIEVELTQTGDDIRVKTRYHQPFSPRNMFGGVSGHRIDIAVIVPAATNLRLKLNSGDAEITGIEGEMDLNLNSGNFTGRDLRVTGQGELRVNSGDARFERVAVAAPLHFEINSGNLGLREVSFAGDVALEANSGNIKGDISLGEGAQLRMNLNSGAVNLSLPATTAAHIEADAMSGSVRITGFPVTVTRRYASARASGDFAPNPTSSITCHINSGSFAIAAR